MRTQELLAKLDLIEEQARRTLDELPPQRARERQLMIIAAVKQVRWAVAEDNLPLTDDPEATVRLPS